MDYQAETQAIIHFPSYSRAKKTPLPQIVNKASLIKNREFSSRILLVTENARTFANEQTTILII